MPDTPRTDAAERKAHGIPDGFGLLPNLYVPGDFARQLEHELTAAKELLREIRDDEVNAQDEADKFLRDHQPSELAKWQAEAARLSAEREHNANMAGMWQALAEGLADELQFLLSPEYLHSLNRDEDSEQCLVASAHKSANAALAAYEAAKAGGAAAKPVNAVDSVALAKALLETRDIQVYGDGCSTQERDTWILAKMIDEALGRLPAKKAASSLDAGPGVA